MVVSEEVPGLFKTQLGQAVLILVLMDGGIGGLNVMTPTMVRNSVLILVLMDGGIGEVLLRWREPVDEKS